MAGVWVLGLGFIESGAGWERRQCVCLTAHRHDTLIMVGEAGQEFRWEHKFEVSVGLF